LVRGNQKRSGNFNGTLKYVQRFETDTETYQISKKEIIYKKGLLKNYAYYVDRT
jgi:hypothetical protein